MQNFTIQPATAPLNPFSFDTLTPGVAAFLAREVDIKVEIGVNATGIGRQFVLLEHISFNNFMALHKLGCENIKDLWKAAEYTCPLSQRITHSVLPVGILTKDLPALNPYRDAFSCHHRSGAFGELLHVLPDANRFSPENPLAGTPTRFEAIQMGCGYTLSELGTRDVRREAAWVALRLSNGDELLALAFKTVAVDERYIMSQL